MPGNRAPRLVAFLFASIVAVAFFTPAGAAPEGAATGLSFGRETCQPNGTVSVRLSWTPSRLGDQYVELATDAGFTRQSAGGPYAATASYVMLTELAPGSTYYTRIRTVAGTQNLYSDAVAITPTGCGAPPPSGGGSTAAAGTFNLVSAHSGRCLEIYGISQANFATAVQWYCWGGANQALQAIPTGDGYFQLRFAHSGRCLEVMNWRLDNGAPLGQYACHGGDNQRWSGSFNNGAQSVIRSKFSGKCVDVYGWGLGDGAPIAQWDCHSGANQQWRTRTAASTPSNPSTPTGPVIAITIDTDTIRGYMPQMLDTLDAYGVRASFGVTGPWALNNPDLVRRMVAAGHTIMNHSWDHPAFVGISTAERQDQLRRTEAAILQVGGVSSKPYFRPPYGSTNASVRADAAAEGYRIVLWSIDPQGWRGYSGETIANHILSRAFNGAVILMHSTNAGDLAALGPTIQGLRARGYTFVTIAQLSPP